MHNRQHTKHKHSNKTIPTSNKTTKTKKHRPPIPTKIRNKHRNQKTSKTIPKQTRHYHTVLSTQNTTHTHKNKPYIQKIIYKGLLWGTCYI